MDEQPPKPRRDWRSFGKEYVIVVLGVATALAAQQAADWLHWRGEVALARERLANEVALNLFGAILRIRTASCGERRLDALGLVLDDAAETGKLVPVGDIGVPTQRFWTTGVWDTVVASQAAPHFPARQLYFLAAAYRFVGLLQADTSQELEDWKDLYPMVGPGRRLDPASEARLREALSRARASNRVAAMHSLQLLRLVKDLGLSFSPSDRALIADARQTSLTESKHTLFSPNGMSICEPIGLVPAGYGHAPYSPLRPLMDEGIRRIPELLGDAP